MEKENLQEQINELNRKLDILLEESFKEKQRREQQEDLMKDLSLIGKDLYDTAVERLDNEGVDLNDEVIVRLLFKLLRDIEIIYELLSSLESAYDLVKDLSPIVNQVGRDLIHKLSDMEQKGYLKLIASLTKVSDSFVKYYKPEDAEVLAKRVETLVELSRLALTSTLLEDTKTMLEAYEEARQEKPKKMGLLRAMRELSKPEMKKSLGFLVSMLNKFSQKMNF